MNEYFFDEFHLRICGYSRILIPEKSLAIIKNYLICQDLNLVKAIDCNYTQLLYVRKGGFHSTSHEII